MKKVVLVLVMAILAAGAVRELRADTQVLISASRNTAFIADPITLKIIVKTDADADKIKITTAQKEFEILSRSAMPPQKQNNETVFESDINIAFFKTGDFTVGPFTVQLLKGDQVIESPKTNTLSIRIETVLGEKDKDIKPLKELVDIKGNPFYVLKYVLLALLLAGLILLGIYYLKKRKRQEPQVKKPLLKPVEELAQRYAELNELRLMEKGRIKEHFLRLTEIIKQFLNREYRFNAEDLTTYETMLYLKSHENTPDLLERMDFVLETADMAKFAKYIPGSEKMANLETKFGEMIDTYRRRLQTEVQEKNVSSG